MRNAKRLLIVLLSLTLVLGTVFALSACGKKECDHDWNAATCTAPKTCKKCSATEGEALGHSGGTATCTEAAKCSACGVSYGEKAAHDYADATCVAPKTCKACQATEGTALGHLDENKDHACDRTGCTAAVGDHADADKDHICDYGCAEKIGNHEDVSPKDHKCDWCGAVEFGTHANGTINVHICDYCGGAAPDSVCVDTNKDHACDIGCNTPVGTHEDTNHDHNCDYGCAEKIGTHEDTNHDHNCDYGCAEKLGTHADSDSDNDHDCDYGCGVMLSGHSGGTASCSAQAECEVCGVSYGAFASHDFTEETKTLAYVMTPATCTDAAVYYYSCSVCGASEANPDHTFLGAAADGHKWGVYSNVTIENVEYHVRTCKVCHEDEQGVCEYIPTAPLSSGTENLGAPATCLNPAKCSVCANEYGVANGHTWNGGVETTPATCETAGVMTYTCACSATKTEAIAPLGHTWDDGVETTPATCTTVGVKTYTCQNNAEHKKTEQIAALGHLPNIPAPTCTDDQVCTREGCGVTIAPATGHSYDVAEGSATCTEARVDTYTCRNCNASYTETVGAALGHSFTDLAIDDKRTSEKSCEYTKYKYCDRCESEIAVDTYTNHDSWTATIATYATCTTPGRKILTCPTCKATEEEEIPVDLELGHAWNEGVTADGITTYTCSHDGTHTKTVKTVTAADTLTKDDLSNELKTENGSFNLGGASEAIGDKEVNLSSGTVNKEELNLTPEQQKQIGNAPVYEFVITDKATGDTVADFGEGNYVTVTLPYPQFNKEEDDADAIAIWFINDAGELEAIMATYNDGYVTFQTNHFSKYTVTRLKPAERCALYGHSSTFKINLGSCLENAYVLEYCVRCGYTNETVLWWAPMEHAYEVDASKDATCTEDGYIRYKCGCEVPAEIKDLGDGYEVKRYDLCKHSYTEVLPALKHNYVESTRTDATCAAPGEVVYVCSNNEMHTHKEVLPQLPHDYDAAVTEPTCTTGGFTTHTCLNPDCGDFYVDSYTAPLAHTYSGFDHQWNDDKTVVTLILHCDNCSEGDISAPFALAELAKKEIKASCATDGKMQYFARLTVNGEAMSYLVKEDILSSADAHEFSDTINMFDENTHWKGCKCGEKKDEAAHTFGEGIVTKVASCDAAGEITYSCDCGYVKTEKIPQLAHSFVNGVCSACGKRAGKGFYVTLLESYKTLNGFAIRIEDLFLEVIRDGELQGRMTLDLAELMLYVEDGELKGAAKGAVVIYNGPYRNEDAYFALEAVIDDGYVYIVLSGGHTPDEQTVQLKYSLADVLSMMMGMPGMGGGAGDNPYMSSGMPGMDPDTMAAMVGFLTETVIPTVDILLETNADGAEELLENLFAILFTVEKVDGGYVFTLDYEKLSALNANLATLPVAELIDVYFGEGAFDALVDGVRALLALKLSELPDALASQGIDVDALIVKINELCALMGAPAGFDISEMLKDPDVSQMTLGMLLAQGEDYEAMVDQIVSTLRSMPLYSLIAPEHEEEIKGMVDMVIEMIKDSITVSFSTNEAGSLTDLDFALNEFVIPNNGTEVTVSGSLGIALNGKIDVTWGDIIADINGAIVLPSEDMKNDEPSIDQSMDKGEMEYKGELYSYEASIITIRKTDYDRLLGIMMQADCTGWMAYQAMYGYAYASFGRYSLYDTEGNVAHMLVKNEITGETVALVQTQSGITVIYEDGRELAINLSTMSGPMDMFVAIFGEIEYVSAPGFGASIDYYYNKTTGEYSDESRHEVTETVEKLGETCEDGIRYIYTCTCKDCDYRSERTIFYHEIMIQERIPLAGTCNPDAYITYGECPCGKDARVDRFDTCLSFHDSNRYEGDDGKWHEVTEWKCDACGLTLREDRYTERDASTCTEVTYYEDSVTIGTELIKVWEYESFRESHDHYVTDAILKDGSTSCEDGVTLIYTCRDCGDFYENYIEWHQIYEIARYDLQDPAYGGAYHQGYLVERGCACGERHEMQFDTLCDIDMRYEVDLWIDGVMGNAENGYYWVSFDSDGFCYGHYSEAWRQTCAVTDPVQCAYTIRRASYWKKLDGACFAERYETWQLGYNTETGAAHEITFKTGESRQYHPYIVYESEDTIHPNSIRTITYTCPDCGSTAYDKITYGANSEWIERVMYAENKSAYGDCKVREERYEYCNGYEFLMYEYVERMDGEWEKWEYEGFCQATVTYSSSDGGRDPYDEERHHRNGGCKQYPTCTQEGIYGEWCPVCDTVLDASREEPPYDHSWQQVEENLWICGRCGIQNANGSSGEVVLEDMTMLYGAGEYYVAGYWARNNATFEYRVALVLAQDGDQILLPDIDVIELTNVRAVAFRMAEVRAAAEALGLSPEDYEVKLSFVPYDNLDEDDYGITFDKNYGDGSETVTGPITLQFMMGWDSKVITINPEVSGRYQIAVYTNRGCDVRFYDNDGRYDLPRNFECLLNAENSYRLEILTDDQKFADPVTVIITYLGEAQ